MNRVELFTGTADKTAQSQYDSLYTLADGIADNLTPRLAVTEPHWSSLASYVGDTLRRCVAEVREKEQWQLIGQDPPVELEHIDRLLVDLHATLAELAWGDLDCPTIVQAARSGDYKHALARVADHARAMCTKRTSTRQNVFRAAACKAGLRVEVIARSLEHPDAVYWPPTEIAVMVEIIDVTDWPHILHTMQALLPHDPGADGGRPAILIIPTVGEKPIPHMAQRLITTMWPDTGPAYARWANTLPPPHPTPLTDAVVNAHQALRGLSGIAVFATHRELDARHDTFAQREVERYRLALQAIDTMQPADSVISEIIRFLKLTAQRVQAELDDGPPTSEGQNALSVGLSRGTIAAPTDDMTTLQGLLAICLQWDINSATAVHMLEQP
ncbi:hypothetical protein ACFQ1S_01790 [Kibdelosporangium lantanae]|uniref:Uncharacterized protein n=1 Tax=Kibdelosporangium lantanae TaxID=1497396 RepID=A0ABW3M295_9PSEU